MTEPTVAVPASVVRRTREVLERVAEDHIYTATGDYLLEVLAALPDPDQARRENNRTGAVGSYARVQDHEGYCVHTEYVPDSNEILWQKRWRTPRAPGLPHEQAAEDDALKEFGGRA